MPTYTTPNPIDVAITMPVGAIDVIASDRADTVVTVSPTNPEKSVDRRGAEETKVDFDGERLTIKGPRARVSFMGPSESVDVTIELPSGSRLTAELAVGRVRSVGRLGATRIKATTGGVEVDSTGDLWLRAGHGAATVGSADGGAEITADHGQIRVGLITGDAILNVATALSSVSAKTAYGAIQLHEVSSGSLQLESGYGLITVGVREGVAAWLDLSSKEGRVRNQLDGDRAPETSDPSVAVRARTQFGDITIQRAR